jgi:uncharacterized protein (DUF1697 family)
LAAAARKMETLRRLFETLGFSDVSTFIASGNVVFETPSKDPECPLPCSSAGGSTFQ